MEIVIPRRRITEMDVTQFVENLERMTGEKIEADYQWVLRCDNPLVMEVLAQLFGEVLPAKRIGKQGKKRKTLEETSPTPASERPFVLKPGNPRPVKSWKLIDVKGTLLERITNAEKDARLAAGAFETGQLLEHPNNGRRMVVGEKGSPQVLGPVSMK